MVAGKPQRGFLLIVAVILIAVAATMAAVIATFTAGSGQAGGLHVNSTQALFVAESGLERGAHYLLAPDLNRTTCAAVPAANTAVGLGEFSLAVVAGSPFYTANAPTLTAALVAATPSPIAFLAINGAGVAGLAPFGRVMIDRELFDYESIGNAAAQCGGGASPCLRGVIRARDGTTATAHAAGARVGQFQCTLTATGGVPSLANSNGRRVLSTGMQMQEAWFVGDNGVIVRGFNNTLALFVTTGTQLRAVSLDSYANGWTVGALVGGEAQIRQWNPDGTPAWNLNNYPNIPNDAQLNAVHSISRNEAWAVGNDRMTPNDTMIMHWNGTNWVYVDPAGNFDDDLDGVFVLDTNDDGIADDGWAVGEAGSIRRGMTWGAFASPTGAQLNGVYLNNANDGWIVGNSVGGPAWRILRWVGGPTWTIFPVGAPTPVDLNAVTCTSTTDCWAVGDPDGCANNVATILRWNGAVWGCSPGVPAVNQALNAVACAHSNDCWAVGNAGTMLHWDGNVWTQIASPTGQTLRGVSIVAPHLLPKASAREVFR